MKKKQCLGEIHFFRCPLAEFGFFFVILVEIRVFSAACLRNFRFFVFFHKINVFGIPLAKIACLRGLWIRLFTILYWNLYFSLKKFAFFPEYFVEVHVFFDALAKFESFRGHLMEYAYFSRNIFSKFIFFLRLLDEIWFSSQFFDEIGFFGSFHELHFLRSLDEIRAFSRSFIEILVIFLSFLLKFIFFRGPLTNLDFVFCSTLTKQVFFPWSFEEICAFLHDPFMKFSLFLRSIGEICV